jgi:hypothetical protein
MMGFLKASASVAVHSIFVLALIGGLNRTALGRAALGTDAQPSAS